MRSATIVLLLTTWAVGLTAAAPTSPGSSNRNGQGTPQRVLNNIQLGPRPYYLVDNMDEGELRSKLASCTDDTAETTDFSVGHRGAALQFPEHTRQSIMAAARMGAGIIECDVIFTKDRQLVCRHSQCDLHQTTNILTIPSLAAKCSTPFTPENGTKPANAKCCTSDITLAEFKTLCGKMDGFNANATTVADYLAGTPKFRTDLYSTCGTLMSHKEYIGIIDGMGRKFIPELKTPSVKMPYEGNYTQAKYAQQMIDEYKAARISPDRVWTQSFSINDIFYWLKNEPAFGKQSLYLDDRVDSPEGYKIAVASLQNLSDHGLQIIAPPMNALLSLDAQKRIVPSDYAIASKAAGLDILTWTFERSGLLAQVAATKEYYYASVASAIDNDGDAYTVLDVLARQVGIIGIFSDWPATVTYYANCFGL